MVEKIVTVQHCTVQYCTVQHCTALYSTVQYCTVLYSTVQYCKVVYSTVQYCAVQYCTVQYYLIYLVFHLILSLDPFNISWADDKRRRPCVSIQLPYLHSN